MQWKFLVVVDVQSPAVIYRDGFAAVQPVNGVEAGYLLVMGNVFEAPTDNHIAIQDGWRSRMQGVGVR
jgi:hypothetical protein